MLKKISILIFCIILDLTLLAKEPQLAILRGVESNEIQRFSIGNYTFKCQAYGVLTLETLYKTAPKDSECQKSIDRFYKKNPTLFYYVDEILKYKQQYHVEIKNQKCIIYASAEVTLSELLIKNGLAVKKIIFKDEEFNSYFISAQRKAKIDKKGLWGENIFNDCISELNK